jgi:hypothetical protein
MMVGEYAHANRRQHVRVAVGLPMDVHLPGRSEPLTVELIDIAERGVRFRALSDAARIDQRATFMFLVPDQGCCTAEGHVSRVGVDGEFIVVIDQANDAFQDFVRSLA